MLPNLLSDVLTYGLKDKPVKVKARSSDSGFTFGASNQCEAIPAATIGKLFKPLVRGNVHNLNKGLGFRLYISSEIARAHEGELMVKYGDGVTTFILIIPSHNI